MSFVNYTGDDEALRSTVYPLMEEKTPIITIGGFEAEQEFAGASLPSAMIKHMTEKGAIVRETAERPSTMKAASAKALQTALEYGSVVVAAVLKFIQQNPALLDWMRNGMDFWRLDQYRLVVYKQQGKGIFMEFRIR